ncbi:MAG: hypothetical protein AAF585_13380 [Verrucomicrobiota bacterium]
MAGQKPTDLEREKAALKQQLARCRREGADSLHDLARSFDIPRQLQASLRGGGWKWVVGALAAGAAVGLALMPSKSKRAKNKDGKNQIGSILIRTAISMAKPLLGSWAQKEVEKWVKGALHKS